MSWLCLYAPRLALECQTPRATRPEGAASPAPPQVLHDARQRIRQCDDAAWAAGLRPGQSLAAARALQPRLEAREPDAEASAAAQQRLLCLACAFSGQVVDAGEGVVLLEVGRSLRLFGGLAALQAQLRAGLPAGWTVRQAVAPTPLGAQMLAAFRPGQVLPAGPDWAAALDALPLTLLDAGVAERLRASGVDTLAALRRLPRAGLKRRCGAGFVDALERLLGERPDPRPLYQPPQHWSGRRHFEPECATLAELAPARQALLDELAVWLRARDLVSRQLRWELELAGGGSVIWEVWPGTATRDVELLEQLSALKAERCGLEAPVRTLRLAARELLLPEAPQRALLPGAADAREELSPLWARLAARLGPQALCRVQACDEHRPERAWERREVLDHTPPAPPPGLPRPLWLLAAPQPLDPATLDWLGPPERIESGWWDGAPMRRDYHQARARDGSRLWVYREHAAPGGWFVHGLYA